MANDPYAELGVARGASADDIRKSFRKLAKALHPDRNPGDAKAEERFKRVSAAFDILGDVDKKAKFDRGEIDADGREAQRGFDPRQAAGAYAARGAGMGGGGRFDGAPDFEDILGEMFGRGGGGGGARGFAARGQDVRSRLEIDLDEAIRGGSKRVAFPDGRQIDVTIPKGAHDGQTLRLKGQGQPGRGGAAGDALIEIGVRVPPLYRLDGSNLHMDLPVSLPDMVLGAKVQAPTPDGEVSLTVPRGSNSGAVLRLKGRGAVGPDGGPRGDLFAKLLVALPEPPEPTSNFMPRRCGASAPTRRGDDSVPAQRARSKTAPVQREFSETLRQAGMRRAATLALAALTFVAAPAARAQAPAHTDSLGADWAPQQDQARSGVKAGRYVPLSQVVATVARRTPGRLLDAGIEDDGAGREVYRVRWSATSGRRLDVIVDAATGAVVREEGR